MAADERIIQFLRQRRNFTQIVMSAVLGVNIATIDLRLKAAPNPFDCGFINVCSQRFIIRQRIATYKGYMYRRFAMRSSQHMLLISAVALGLGLNFAPLSAAWAASSGASGTTTTKPPVVKKAPAVTKSVTKKAPVATDANKIFLKAKAMVTAGDYAGAVTILEKIVAKDPANADAFNLLGFSNRKLGNMDKALGYYNSALALNPNHVGANEYLGELYLELNNLPKAQERLDVLTTTCSNCSETADLAKLIADFKAKAG